MLEIYHTGAEVNDKNNLFYFCRSVGVHGVVWLLVCLCDCEWMCLCLCVFAGRIRFTIYLLMSVRRHSDNGRRITLPIDVKWWKSNRNEQRKKESKGQLGTRRKFSDYTQCHGRCHINQHSFDGILLSTSTIPRSLETSCPLYFAHAARLRRSSIFPIGYRLQQKNPFRCC